MTAKQPVVVLATAPDGRAAAALLAPVLAGYPEVPEGYDGWWRF